MARDDNCTVCGGRITMPGWGQGICCEVCWDSYDAEFWRWAERAGVEEPEATHLSPTEPDAIFNRREG